MTPLRTLLVRSLQRWKPGYLLLAGIAILSSSCLDNGTPTSSGDLTLDVEKLRDAHAAAEKKNTALAGEYDAALAAKEAAKKSIGNQIKSSADLEIRRLELGEELTEIRKEFDSYKAKYRNWARSAAKGYVFPSLDTGDGNVLTQAKITSLDATTVGLTTAKAIKAVPLEQLSETLRDQLGYDPSASAAGGLSVMQRAEIAIDEAGAERVERSKEFKEMLRARNRLLDREDALIEDNLAVPKELSDRIDSLQVDLKLNNDRSAQLIRIINWNIRLLNNRGVPPPGPRPE